MQELLLDVPQAAQVLNVGKRKIYRMVREREIPSIFLGSSIRIPRQALSDWIDEKMIVGESEKGEGQSTD